jgi:hypothetical protein
MALAKLFQVKILFYIAIVSCHFAAEGTVLPEGHFWVCLCKSKFENLAVVIFPI